MSTSNIRIEEVRSLKELERYEPCWNPLVRRCPSPSVFLTYEWLTTWWRCHQEKARSLLILLAFEKNDFIGIAPLMQVRKGIPGLSVSKIEFLSMMSYADSPVNCSGQLDFIIPDRHSDVIPAFIDHLRQKSRRWGYIRLHPISADSPSLHALEETAHQRGWSFRKHVVFDSFFITPEHGWSAYFALRSPNLRKKLRNLENRLQKQGKVFYCEYRSIHEVEECFRQMIEIEKSSWKWDIGISINSAVLKNFYETYAKEAAKASALRMWFLEVDGKKIAYNFDVEFEGNVETLKCSFNQEYARFSPGLLLDYREYEHILQRTTRKIDLMWGNEEYKQQWATEKKAYYELFIFNIGVISRLLHFFLFGLSLYDLTRPVPMTWRRFLRKLGLHPKTSELTRMDQVHFQ